MHQQLPAKPNLRWLKNQAKSILKAYRRGDVAPMEVFRNLYRFADEEGDRSLRGNLTLGEVHFALARHYGFSSWAKLKTDFEGVEKTRILEVDTPSVDGDFRDDAQARELYNSIYFMMEEAQTFGYTSEYRYFFQGEAIGEGYYQIAMKKPNFVRIEAVEHGTGNKGVLVGDGEQFWIHWPGGKPRWDFDDDDRYEKYAFHSYMKQLAPKEKHLIDHEFWKIARWMGMSILNPSAFHKRSHQAAYLDGVMHHGENQIDGIDCHLIEVSFMHRQRSKYIWASVETSRPVLLRETVRVNTPIYINERWTDVAIDEELPDEMFRWSPPEDWKEYRMPMVKEGILKPGQPAPDFRFPLIDGRSFRLSKHRGKVVWLAIWRVGCPPCRREIPELNRIREKYSADDVVVVAANIRDRKEKVEEFLRENDITFPIMHDTSEEAFDTFYRMYQTVPGMSAVPMHYILDREGAVVTGFYRDGIKSGVSTVDKILYTSDT